MFRLIAAACDSAHKHTHGQLLVLFLCLSPSIFLQVIPHDESKAMCEELKKTDMKALMDVHTSNYFITDEANMVDIR